MALAFPLPTVGEDVAPVGLAAWWIWQGLGLAPALASLCPLVDVATWWRMVRADRVPPAMGGRWPIWRQCLPLQGMALACPRWWRVPGGVLACPWRGANDPHNADQSRLQIRIMRLFPLTRAPLVVFMEGTHKGGAPMTRSTASLSRPQGYRAPLDGDAILSGDLSGIASHEESACTVANALISVAPSHWLGADYQADCFEHAAGAGIVFC